MSEIENIINSILLSSTLATIVIVYFTIEAIKTTELVHNKFLPLVAMFTGVVVGSIIAFLGGASVLAGGLLGILSGGFASGLYKAIFPNDEKID